MPIEIPTYFSRSAPRVIDRGGTSPESTGAPVARGLRSVASVLADIDIDAERQVGNAERLGEYEARKGRLTDRLGALKDSLEGDPDHRTYFDRAKKGIQEATTEALAGVNDPELKNALLEKVSSIRDTSLMDARDRSRALRIDFTRGELEKSIDRNIGIATTVTEAADLMRAEGEIDAAVTGAVKGGIWTAEYGGKIARGAREKIHTTLAEQMADREPGRFLSNYKEGLYKDTVDPLRLEGIRRYAENRNQAVDAAVASSAIWEELGPKRDEDPSNEDLMVRGLEAKFAGEPEKAKLAIADLKMKAYAHDKGVKERKDANLSAVWKASLAGQSLPSIIAMPEYSALDGAAQVQVKEHLQDRSWTMKGRVEGDPSRKAAQHDLYWRYSQPSVLAGMSESNITALYPSLGVELTDKLMATRRDLDNPAKAAEAKIDQDDLNHWAEEYGIDPWKKANHGVLGGIKYRVETAIAAEQRARGGKMLSREEKAKILKRGLVEVDVRVNQTFWGKTMQKKRFFDVQYPENIFVPRSERDAITADLTARGIPVNEDNVRALYIQRRVK